MVRVWVRVTFVVIGCFATVLKVRIPLVFLVEVSCPKKLGKSRLPTPSFTVSLKPSVISKSLAAILALKIVVITANQVTEMGVERFALDQTLPAIVRIIVSSLSPTTLTRTHKHKVRIVKSLTWKKFFFQTTGVSERISLAPILGDDKLGVKVVGVGVFLSAIAPCEQQDSDVPISLKL